MRIVTIKTKKEEAKRIIINTLKENYQLYPAENLDFEMRCYFPSEIVSKIITELILANKLDVVEFCIDLKENIPEPKKEKSDEPKRKDVKRNNDKKREEMSIRQIVKQHIINNNIEVINIDQFCEDLGLEKSQIRYALTLLKKQKFVENPSRSVWIRKREQKDKAEDKKESNLETNAEEKAGGKIIKEVKKSIFTNVSYEEIMKYVMERNRFSIETLRKKFPIEEEKIPIVIRELLEKEHIKEDVEKIGIYYVDLSARVLYYIQNHPRVTVPKICIDMHISLEKKNEIYKVIEQLLQSEKILKTKNGGYKIISNVRL